MTSPSRLRSESTGLHWLERYARHQGLALAQSSVPVISPAMALKQRFTAAAWRVVCRSPRSAFLPILSNRRLGFADLVRYAQGLADRGFRVAPLGQVLSAFLRSSYPFFDKAPLVPVGRDELAVMRLASQEGCIRPRQLHCIQQWLRAGHKVAPRMSLAAVLQRARAWQARQQAQASTLPWTFACAATDWFGFEFVPLTTAVDLWDEGQAMSTCLYSLRAECDSEAASRFFSIRKAGRRHATLELSWSARPAEEGGRSTCAYHLRDCRLSANRIPTAELIALASRFAAHYDQLAQRQGLSPQRGACVPWKPLDWGEVPQKRSVRPGTAQQLEFVSP